MEYVKFGSTGIKVSRLSLGCMTFGDPDRGNHPWTLDEEKSRPIVRQAIEQGINFFDTANVYSDGSSEEITGRLLKEFANRDDIVLATKVYNRMRPGPNGMGLSRKAIMQEIDASLTRLGTDYVDLYQMGKARYIGASSMPAWRFAKALYVSRLHGWTEFVSMQNHVNLLYREEEREMLPLCAEEGVAVMPWSPLARGRLTRPWDETTERLRTDDALHRFYGKTEEADRRVVDALGEVAERRGVPRAQIALAWLLRKGRQVTPIIGASKPNHLTDAIAALTLELSAEECAALEAPYIPHAVSGYS
jgi:1-deoxyxylulose-5-phosphate synthase